MIVKNLNLNNFRLYETFKISFNDHINIIKGNNGQGKTTILESLYFLGLTKSHKTNNDKDVIKNNTQYAKINSLINFKEKDSQLSVVVSKTGKKAKYNQIELSKLSEYIGILNVVMFAPEDIELIKGNPQLRRRFLDLEIGQISKKYLFNLQNYRKILKERNNLLKSMQQKQVKDYILLDIITDQLLGYLDEIVKTRKDFLEKISDIAVLKYQEISKSSDELLIQYVPSIDKNYKTEFSSKYQYDIVTGSTSYGVHKDDVEFYLNSKSAKAHCSQGEIRTIVLSIKLALIDFIKNVKGDYPILLLDDVLSELDEKRQNQLLKNLNINTQVFITTTNIKEINFNKMENYKIFEINNGQIKECIKDEPNLWFK